jgi:hypothetical protein
MNQLPDDYIPNKLRAFVGSIAYARPEYLDVLTMMLIVSHAIESFTTVPQLIATATEPASGKSTIAYDLPMLLAHNMESYGREDTEPALATMFYGREKPNLGLDDVGKIFGDAGANGKHLKIYAVLIKAYRRGSKMKMSVNRVNALLDIYCMCFMNGLHKAVPDDLYTRAIHFKMEEAPSGLELRDALEQSTINDAKILREAVHGWAGSRRDQFTAFMRGKVRAIHPKLEKRRRQVWGPVFAAADAAGGDWPRRIFDAFVAMALDASEKPVLLPDQRCLMDASSIIMRSGESGIFTSDLIAELRALPDGQYYRDAEDEHLATRLLPEALGPSKRITSVAMHGDYAGQAGQAKGWKAAKILKDAADLHDMLYPPMASMEPDDTDAELAFTPI